MFIACCLSVVAFFRRLRGGCRVWILAACCCGWWAGPGLALVAPQDWIFHAPEPSLPHVRVVRTIGDTDALRIESHSGEVLRRFVQAELVHPREAHMAGFSRRGAPWMEGALVLQDGHLFVVRLASGRLLVFDLNERELLSPLPPEDPMFTDFAALLPRVSEETLAELHEKIKAKAVANLQSSRFQERIVAATLCGEYGLREAIPVLRALADSDPSYATRYTSHRGSGERIYPVREAAKAALSKLEE